MEYWKKGSELSELHVQNGFEWGNDLTCTEGGDWGTYIPLSREEHKARGYEEISREEAVEMAEIAGYELED
jgi:hypothetical protein